MADRAELVPGVTVKVRWLGRQWTGTVLGSKELFGSTLYTVTVNTPPWLTLGVRNDRMMRAQKLTVIPSDATG